MPTEVIDALAGMNVEQAVFLAVGLFGTGAAVTLLLANAHHLCPQPVLQAAVHAGHDLNRAVALAALHASKAVLLARIWLVAALLVAVAYLDTTPSRNGGTR